MEPFFPLRTLLAPNGVITLEFPHLERPIEENQFDTICHEHFSYFSLVTIVVMKVVLFCEGLGDRVREYSETIPKPRLGCKANVIKDHFLSYGMTASTDCIVSDFA
jgi:hypothetical protein